MGTLASGTRGPIGNTIKLTLTFMRNRSPSGFLILFLAGSLTAQSALSSKQRANPSTEDECHRALLEGTGNVRAADDVHGLQTLIPVYSDGKIDAYIDQQTMDEATGPSFNGAFDGRLYSAYRDETTRQQAIARLRKKYGPPVQTSCRTLQNSGGYADVPCMGHTETFENLKYVMMGVVTGAGPFLRILERRYLVPMRCAEIDPATRGARLDQSGYETILVTEGPTQLATDWTFGSTKPPVNLVGAWVASPIWNLLLGDLTLLEHKPGVGESLRLDTPQTVFVYQVVNAAREKIRAVR